MTPLNLFQLVLVFLSLASLSKQQLECDANRHCPVGCCSSAGYCGYGPDFCGDGCVSTCDRKSECQGPGWNSDQFSEGGPDCPLNVCCSKHGFCGVTDEFCGEGATVQRPRCPVANSVVNRVIGYYESWSFTERDCMGMNPEDIPYGVYTHVIFSFATIDPNTFEILPGSTNTELLMSRIGALKLLQPDLKIWVAVGGWTFNDPWMPTAHVFSDLAASEEKQDTFFNSLNRLMNAFNFDGIDVDWEYPVDMDRGGRPEDYKNFVTFMQRLNNFCKTGGRNLGTSLTLPSSYWYLKQFDIVELQEHVDWFNLMSYDIHGSWDIDNSHTGPYVNAHTNLTEIQIALDLLWRNDIRPDKVTLGTAFYSRSFTLEDPECSSPGCVVASGGNAGRCSGTTGVLLNPEIAEIVQQNQLQPQLHRKEAVKTVSWGNQWVSFDDEVTWRLKANLARSQCITGVMVWAASQDDAEGTNARALTSAFGKPIPEIIDFNQKQPSTPPTNLIQTCRWSNCLEGCPDGWKEMERAYNKDPVSLEDTTGCSHIGDTGTSHKFCCPSNVELPTCTSRGAAPNGLGYCGGGCDDGEIEVGTHREHCHYDHQSFCCTKTPSTTAYGECRWVGESPTCSSAGQHAECPGDYPLFLVATSFGAGGESRCATGAKSLCCKGPEAPPDFTNCRWYRDATNYVNLDRFPEPSCPKGQLRLAQNNFVADSTHLTGWEAYCCEGEPQKDLIPKDNPYADPLFQQFLYTIDRFMEDRTCPRDVLDPHRTDVWPNGIKRSLLSDVEARQDQSRDKCTLNDYNTLVGFLAIVYKAYIVAFKPLYDAWDNAAMAIDNQVNSTNGRQFVANYEADPYGFAGQVVYDYAATAEGMSDREGFNSVLCETHPNVEEKRTTETPIFLDPYSEGEIQQEPESANSTLSARAINFSGRRRARLDGEPSLIDIFEAIERGDMTLVHMRWFPYRGGTTFHTVPGAEAEVVYYNNRVLTEAPNRASAAYRRVTDQGTTHLEDLEARGLHDDFFTIHIHFDSLPPGGLFLYEGSEVYIGASQLNFRHNQETINNPSNAAAGWQVANEPGDPLVRSNPWPCRRDRGSNNRRFYLGRAREIDPSMHPSRRAVLLAIQNWAARMTQEGYFRRPSLERAFSNFDVGNPVVRCHDDPEALWHYPFTMIDGVVNAFTSPPPPR